MEEGLARGEGELSCMKTIGLLGGMSWESTVFYYQIINRTIAERLGGLHSAKILLYSVDFEEVARLQRADRWAEAGEMLAESGAGLEAGGADFLVMCCNTMHKVAPAIERRVKIPFLHIADATAGALRRAGIGRVGLIGTRFTMEDSFIRGRLAEGHHLQVLIPPPDDRELIHRVIYDELCRGKVEDRSRLEFRRIMTGLADRGAEGVILGCTEISMLVGDGDATVPLFDTAAIHARSAASFALDEG
jgi:aspartate racemase